MRVARPTLLTIAVLSLGACGEVTGRQVLGPQSVAGRYELVSLEGELLPVVVAQVLANKVEITAGHYLLDPDGTCSTGVTARATTDGVVTTQAETDTCTWTRINTDITFTYSAGETEAGSLIDGALTIALEGLEAVFQK